jgi:hypothetical protein
MISEKEAPPRKLGLAVVSSRPDGEEKRIYPLNKKSEKIRKASLKIIK